MFGFQIFFPSDPADVCKKLNEHISIQLTKTVLRNIMHEQAELRLCFVINLISFLMLSGGEEH